MTLFLCDYTCLVLQSCFESRSLRFSNSAYHQIINLWFFKTNVFFVYIRTPLSIVMHSRGSRKVAAKHNNIVHDPCLTKRFPVLHEPDNHILSHHQVHHKQKRILDHNQVAQASLALNRIQYTLLRSCSGLQVKNVLIHSLHDYISKLLLDNQMKIKTIQ